MRLRDGVSLRPVEDADAEEVHALVEANREFLRPWMPWAGGQDLEGTRGFLRSATAQAAADNGFSAAIVDGNAIVGIVGFHHVDWDHRSTSIGYWLGRDAQGRGTATQAVGALLAHAFERWDLNRVELRAAPENARSRAVAERLGFVEEGVLREAERHRDGYRDLVLYSMLAAEWRSSPARR